MNEARLDTPLADKDVDYIFKILDTTKDGILRRQDFFQEVQSLIHMVDNKKVSPESSETKRPEGEMR